MGKETTSWLKPRRGANFGQDGPSAAKRAAALLREYERAAGMYACDACPHTLTQVCTWSCALSRTAHVYDKRARALHPRS